MLITDELNLNVSGIVDKLLHQKSIVAKRGHSLALSNLEVDLDFVVIPTRFSLVNHNTTSTHHAMRIPLPPPPADALSMTGYPISLATILLPK